MKEAPIEYKYEVAKTIEGQYAKAAQDVYEVELLMYWYPDSYEQMLGQFEELAPLATEWNEMLASGADPHQSELPKKIAAAIAEMKKQAPNILKEHPVPSDGGYLERSGRREALKRIASRYPSPDARQQSEWNE